MPMDDELEECTLCVGRTLQILERDPEAPLPHEASTLLEQEAWKARQRVDALESAIRRHRDERGHNRCWLDDGELYAVLPEGTPPPTTLPPHDEFLSACERFWQLRQAPMQMRPFMPTDDVTQGPWVLSATLGDGDVVVGPAGDVNPIARVSGLTSGVPVYRKRGLAYAALIVAAPLLLTAARVALQHFVCRRRPTCIEIELPRAEWCPICGLQEAVQKATV